LPTIESDPPLITTGLDKTLAYTIGQTFAYKAPFDGKIVEIDEKSGLIVIEEKGNPKNRAFINSNVKSTKNSNGGFYITSKLDLLTGYKIGSSFGKNDLLAIDKSYFNEIPGGNFKAASYKTGLLVKSAIITTDQTFEDSIMISDRLSKRSGSFVTMAVPVTLGSNTKLNFYAKIGDTVTPNSALAKFETIFGTDDKRIHSIISALEEEGGEDAAKDRSTTAKAKYDGVIKEIKLFYNKPLDELDESVVKCIKQFEKLAENKKKMFDKHGVIDPTISFGFPTYITRNKMLGFSINGLLMVYYITVRDDATVGDKFTTEALKGIVSQVFKENEEPVDSNNVPIDYIMSPLSFVSRMTTGAFMTLWTNSVLMELKRQVIEEWEK